MPAARPSILDSSMIAPAAIGFVVGIVVGLLLGNVLAGVAIGVVLAISAVGRRYGAARMDARYAEKRERDGPGEG